MRKTLRIKILSIVMMVSMAVTMMPVMAFATEDGEVASGIQLQNPVVVDGVSTWDCIYFGSYPQSSDGNDGFITEPIKWRVLSVDGDDAFLLADRNLDAREYNTMRTGVTWEMCTLRSWLNSEFLNTAFTSTEQDAIETTTVANNNNPEYGILGGDNTNDQIYLLSIEEDMMPAYGFTSDYCETATREAKNTAYAIERGAWTSPSTDYAGNGYYWLRSPGSDPNSAAMVSNDGYIRSYGQYVDNNNYGVRPVLHINLGSSCWNYAGTVSSDGAEVNVITEAALQENSYEYTGSPITPEPVVKYGDVVLEKDKDYTLSYSDNTEIGTATVAVTGTGSYTGTIEKTFEITKADISTADVTLTPQSAVYTGISIRPEPTVIFNGQTLTEADDYTVKYSSNKSVGTASATITGTGSYTGTITKTFTINPKGTAIKKPAKLKKGFRAKWAKQSAKMSTSRITGYQVRYSLKKNMKNAKIKTVKGYAKTSLKVTKLKAKKKYYIQVRTYKMVNGKKYFSKWSVKKAVTTKK